MLLNGNVFLAKMLPKGIIWSADMAMYMNSDKNKYWFVICLDKNGKLVIVVLAASLCFLLSSCAQESKQEDPLNYPLPEKPRDTSSRKPIKQMMFFEAAKEAADVSNDVLVIPPDPKKENNPEKQ